MRFYINSISMSNSSYLEYYNIQKPEEGAGLVAYSGQTSMSSVGQKALDKTTSSQKELSKQLESQEALLVNELTTQYSLSLIHI